jgi:hypothetical protein
MNSRIAGETKEFIEMKTGYGNFNNENERLE